MHSTLVDENQIKQWFKSQKDSAGKGYSKFITEWKKHHGDEKKEFQQDIVRAYNYLAQKNGFAPVELI